MTTKFVVVDLETTSRNPERAFPVEIAAVEYRPDPDLDPAESSVGRQIVFVPQHGRDVIAAADPEALTVNRYYERQLYKQMVSAKETLALTIELFELLDGATLVAANPAYDSQVLWRFMRPRIADVWGLQIPPWSYRLYDIECSTGVIHATDAVPSLAECCELWALHRDPAGVHTALDDVMTALDVFHMIRGLQR